MFTIMKKTCLRAVIVLITAVVAMSCTKEQSDCGCTDDGKTIPVTFTMSTPAGEAIPYSSQTRATHDEAEWTIHRLSLYVYAVDAEGKGTFLRRYATDETGDKMITIVSNGAGTYNFTLKAPVSDLNAQRRFVFVANDAYAEPDEGESQDELQNKLASIVLEEGNTADLLAAAGKGIAMSGIAQSDGKDVVTITPGVKCEVHLQRIVARVDVQNNTPNLIIKSIELQQAAPKGYLFPHTPVAAADEGYITEAMNAQVNLGTTYAEQTDLKKVFYLYERANAEGDGAQVKVTYTINNSNGEVIVPFQKTSDDKSFVDIERNTLYTIILGNGEPITTNPVSFTLKVEDWNTVDMDEAVDPDEDEQAALNAALKVNMFTPYNVKGIEGKKVTFFDKLAVSFEDCPVDSYFTWEELNAAGLTGNTADAYLTDGAGNKYRMPTEGELNLLLPKWTTDEDREELGPNSWGIFHPWWNDNTSTNDPDVDDGSLVMSDKAATTGWTETIYLQNGVDGLPDQTTNPDETDGAYVVKGQSWMKKGAKVETVHYYTEEPDDPEKGNYNIAPVYGLRFQGTSQYAAYRWQIYTTGDSQDRYLSIKIKALKKDDMATTIATVSQESFWSDGYIEFKLPASGCYEPKVVADEEQDNASNRDFSGYFWSSSRDGELGKVRFLGFNLENAHESSTGTDYSFPLRLVRVQE
ncbi:hypothetical protein [Millionella massiliensis]|uniref:hypothetical protein n=1 Tax=Millionella massiliensis TaxID=1871023 RepID=UPI0008D93160|nr:hypothetical protein [Millionella massiliensis]